MNKYLEYKKCGDVLVPPSLNYKEQYILKCCECNEYFFILDALLDHYLVHDDEKNISIEIKRKTSEDTTVPDDPLTTNQDFNDISDVFKLELDETAIIEVSTRSPPNFLKDNNYGDNKWEEYSNDNFDKRYIKY